MAPKIERIIESIELGEGPHWDTETQSLYFVDILGKSIHKYVPFTNKHTKAIIGTNNVGFIVPLEGAKDKFVIGLGREIAVVTWDGVSENISALETVAEVENHPEVSTNRFNDGKADPSGRLWLGTMGGEPVNGQVSPNKGSFYSIGHDQKIKSHFDQVHISNGLAWNEKLKKFYYIDSGTGTIDSFDFDGENARISNRQTVFTVKEHNLAGLPDGQTIDADGNLWVALFGGKKVIQIDPRIPETLLKVVELPAKQVTSVAFGGPNLDELYVTTARFTMDATVLDPPDHGATYRITGLGVKGLPAAKAKL